MARVIVITSGKGGVGKTTTTSNLGMALARLGHRTLLVDADVGLRNLDLLLGLENRVIYTGQDVLNKTCRLEQALIQDKRQPQLTFFPLCSSQSKSPFTKSQIQELINLVSDKYDFVFASRYEKNCGSDDDTLITLIGNFIFTKIGKIFFNLNVSDILYTYVLGKTNLAKSLNLKSKDFKFCIELPIKANRKGYRLGNSPSYERSRIGGKKKVNAIRDGFLILLGMMSLFFNI